MMTMLVWCAESADGENVWCAGLADDDISWSAWSGSADYGIFVVKIIYCITISILVCDLGCSCCCSH